jgi:hypothetical protein
MGMTWSAQMDGIAAIARRLEAFLPDLPAGDDGPYETGTRWTTLGDLTCTPDWEVGALTIIEDLAPLATTAPDPSIVVPRGTGLLLGERSWINRGPGLFTEGPYFALTVDDGRLAGRTVGLASDTRSCWARRQARRTLAAAFIVPIDSPEIGDRAAVLLRYHSVVAILREAEPYGLPGQPITLDTDLPALGVLIPQEGAAPWRTLG